MSILEIRSLSKRFGRVQAVKELDLRVQPGNIYGILGPNGSGKTTFMRCLLGLHVFQEGSLSVMGENVRHGPAYRRHIGYMPQVPGFPENLSVREIASLVAGVRKVKPDFARGGGLGIEAFLDQKWKTLSGGMKQKVNASLAVAFDAPLLVLDEPTASLDPASRLKLVDLLRAEKARGKCILISTHVLGDLWELADRLAFLREGRVRVLEARSMPGMGTDIGLFERSVAAELEAGA